jgi:hypothetical protein
MFGKAHKLRRLATGLALVASLGAAQPALAYDGRSPDARDAAAGRLPAATKYAPVKSDFPKSDPVIARTSSDEARVTAGDRSSVAVDDSFDWSAFGIGVGIAMASMLLLGGIVVTARRVAA